MTPLHKIPTTQLFAELRNRESTASYAIHELPSMVPGRPTKWGVFKEGAWRDTERGAVQMHYAICNARHQAENVASLLNEQEAARKQADQA